MKPFRGGKPPVSTDDVTTGPQVTLLREECVDARRGPPQNTEMGPLGGLLKTGEEMADMC